MSDTALDGYLTLGVQTAQGTPATVMTTGMRATSVSLSGQTENLLTDPEIGGRQREAAGVALGAFSVGGSIDAYLRYQRLGMLLLAAGFEEVAAPVQDGTTGAYTHTFTPAPPKYLTLEASWGRNRAIRRFVDCLVNELSFEVAGNDFATMSADFVGRQETWQASPVVPVYTTPDPVGSYAGSTLSLGGIGTLRLPDLSATISNNLSDDEFVIGQRGLVDITPGAQEVGFSFTVRVDGAAPQQVTDLYRAAMYGSATATAPTTGDPVHMPATLKFGSGKLVGTSNTIRYGVDLVLPDVVLNAFPLESDGDSVIEASIEGSAFYNGTDPACTIKLYNTVAAKYAA